MNEWFESFFGPDYVDRYARTTDDATTDREVAGVIRLLDLQPPASILDLACGYGRHAVRLAERGFTVTGFDLSPSMLEAAERRAEERGVALTLIEGDMRRLPFVREFDAAVCLFTSFGFFAEETDHVHVAQGVHAALHDGGVFLLDVINRDAVLRSFQPTQWQSLEAGYLLSENSFDPLTSRVSGRQLLLPTTGDPREYPLEVRLFSAHELRLLLSAQGYRDVRVFGSLDGADFSLESGRVVVRGTRS
jgi:SAM-dependent methyltransferase